MFFQGGTAPTTYYARCRGGGEERIRPFVSYNWRRNNDGKSRFVSMNRLTYVRLADLSSMGTSSLELVIVFPCCNIVSLVGTSCCPQPFQSLTFVAKSAVHHLFCNTLVFIRRNSSCLKCSTNVYSTGSLTSSPRALSLTSFSWPASVVV